MINNGKMEVIDLHDMLEKEAYKKLKDLIDECVDKNCTKISVIHGFNNGQVLKKMVHYKFKSKYIIKKEQTLNPGKSIIWLKTKK